VNRLTLAKALRRRLARHYHKGDVAARSDGQILAAYLVCSKCTLPLFADGDWAVTNAQNVDEFLTLTEMALATHRCSAKN